MIYWSSFDWSSFSTLAAGFAAVIGATIVGWRQIGLSKKQLDLLERQEANAEAARLREHQLALQSLQTSLLERRSIFIDDFREVYTVYLSELILPEDDWRKLVKLLQASQLLYPQHIVKKLDAAANGISLYKLHEQRSRHYQEQGRNEEANKRLEKAFEAEDATFEAMNNLLDTIVEASRVIDPYFERAVVDNH